MMKIGYLLEGKLVFIMKLDEISLNYFWNLSYKFHYSLPKEELYLMQYYFSLKMYMFYQISFRLPFDDTFVTPCRDFFQLLFDFRIYMH